jgi:hypothetical protein
VLDKPLSQLRPSLSILLKNESDLRIASAMLEKNQ